VQPHDSALRTPPHPTVPHPPAPQRTAPLERSRASALDESRGGTPPRRQPDRRYTIHRLCHSAQAGCHGRARWTSMRRDATRCQRRFHLPRGQGRGPAELWLAVTPSTALPLGPWRLAACSSRLPKLAEVLPSFTRVRARGALLATAPF